MGPREYLGSFERTGTYAPQALVIQPLNFGWFRKRILAPLETLILNLGSRAVKPHASIYLCIRPALHSYVPHLRKQQDPAFRVSCTEPVGSARRKSPGHSTVNCVKGSSIMRCIFQVSFT